MTAHFSSFGEMFHANAAPMPPSGAVTLTENSAADAHTEFKRLYEMLPANSPAKRRQLLNLLKQYTSLNPQEKAEFDKFVLSGNGAVPQG